MPAHPPAPPFSVGPARDSGLTFGVSYERRYLPPFFFRFVSLCYLEKLVGKGLDGCEVLNYSRSLGRLSDGWFPYSLFWVVAMGLLLERGPVRGPSGWHS